jgi:hypothetical protein
MLQVLSRLKEAFFLSDVSTQGKSEKFNRKANFLFLPDEFTCKLKGLLAPGTYLPCSSKLNF